MAIMSGLVPNDTKYCAGMECYIESGNNGTAENEGGKKRVNLKMEACK